MSGQARASLALGIVGAIIAPIPLSAWEVSFDPPTIFITRHQPFTVGLSILPEEGDDINPFFPGFAQLGYDWSTEGPYTINAPLPLATCSNSIRYCWDISSNIYTTQIRIGRRVKIKNFLTFIPRAETLNLPLGSYSFHFAYSNKITYLNLEIVESLSPKPCNTKYHRHDHYHTGPGAKGLHPTPYTFRKHANLCEEPQL